MHRCFSKFQFIWLRVVHIQADGQTVLTNHHDFRAFADFYRFKLRLIFYSIVLLVNSNETPVQKQLCPLQVAFGIQLAQGDTPKPFACPVQRPFIPLSPAFTVCLNHIHGENLPTHSPFLGHTECYSRFADLNTR